MTREHQFTIIGIAVAATGSAVGMAGVILQMNGYYGFRRLEFILNILRNFRAFVRGGKQAAGARMDATVRLAAAKGEDRVTTLLGLYCVMAGFLLQTIGSALMIWALF